MSSRSWIAAAAMLAAADGVRTRFVDDLATAGARAAQGSEVVATRCGPIEMRPEAV